jgi:hypothetical protein
LRAKRAAKVEGGRRPDAKSIRDVPELVAVLVLPNPPKVFVVLFWPKPPLPNPNDMLGDVDDDRRLVARCCDVKF